MWGMEAARRTRLEGTGDIHSGRLEWEAVAPKAAA